MMTLVLLMDMHPVYIQSLLVLLINIHMRLYLMNIVLLRWWLPSPSIPQHFIVATYITKS